MKTIFDTTTCQQLIKRINALSADQKAAWGKMDAVQMIKHCNLSEEMYLGKKHYTRLFIGRLFGKMALNGIMKNSEPMKRNQPTRPEFKITGSGDFNKEKEKWIAQLNEYKNFSTDTFLHPFFGTMSREQIGIYVYKHTDHHLRQFNN